MEVTQTQEQPEAEGMSRAPRLGLPLPWMRWLNSEQWVLLFGGVWCEQRDTSHEVARLCGTGRERFQTKTPEWRSQGGESAVTNNSFFLGKQS